MYLLPEQLSLAIPSWVDVMSTSQPVGWLAQLAERRSLAGELTLFYPRPVADG